MARKTRTSTAVKARYNAKAYDRFVTTVKKGEMERITAHATSQGESRNAFILRAIEETIERDNEHKGE
jgi:predicted HicB family RNase H-like nuclease